MREINVLLTPGGGPGILAQVASLVQSKRYRARIVLADSNAASGNLFDSRVAKAYLIPSCDSKDYFPALIRVINKENISILYSGLDEEIPLLAQKQSELLAVGCNILLPGVEALETALDKIRTFECLVGAVHMPRTWNMDDSFDSEEVWNSVNGNIVLKISSSRGGRHVYMPEDKEEYDFFVRRIFRLVKGGASFLAQERIIGSEYNVSTFHDKQSQLIYAISRRKFENRKNKSTTVAAVVEKNDAVIQEALSAIRHLKLDLGFNNVELILSDEQRMPYLIEVNGGRTAAQDMNIVSSGISITDLLIDTALGKSVRPIPHPKNGVAILKIRKDVIINYGDIENKITKA